MSGQEGNENSDRRLRNLQGLLNFCTEVTAAEDTTRESSVHELTAERRQFLENALHGLQNDIPKQMARCLEKLLQDCVNDKEGNVLEQEEALDELADYVEDMNYAIDLDKLGGFPIMKAVLSCPHPSLQKKAAELIGITCQNNESCQKSMLALNTMQVLLNIVDSHNDPECKIKALFGLSCLTRNFEPAEQKFVEFSGFCYLMRAIQTKIPKLVIKSILLLNHFIEKSDKYNDMLFSMGFIEQLVTVLFSENVESTLREFCTRTLLNLATSYEKARSECMRPEFNLISQLKENKSAIEGKEEFQDEEQYIDDLLKILDDDEEDDGKMLR